jgi:hypothetical protein
MIRAQPICNFAGCSMLPTGDRSRPSRVPTPAWHCWHWREGTPDADVLSAKAVSIGAAQPRTGH